MPSAIAYDIVNTEMGYGLVYEMAGAVTVSKMIMEHPDRLPEYTVSIEKVNGKVFGLTDTYAVVTNDFCAAGGDTYRVFGNSEKFDTGIVLDEIVTEYIESELKGVITAEKYGKPRGGQKILTSVSEGKSTEKTAAKTTETENKKTAPVGTKVTVKGSLPFRVFRREQCVKHLKENDCRCSISLI